MTIHNEHKPDRITIECDSCDELFHGDEQEEWATVWPRAKHLGWTSRKIASEWIHSCPRCPEPS